MTDVTEWLRARIEARKATAEAIPANERRYRGDGVGALVRVDESDVGGYLAVGPWGCDIDSSHVAHIALNDPRDVIARCDFELAVLDEHEPKPLPSGMSPLYCGTGENMMFVAPFACRTVHQLARAYRHLDGWQPEWKA